jgi:hypothetical protein
MFIGNESPTCHVICKGRLVVCNVYTTTVVQVKENANRDIPRITHGAGLSHTTIATTHHFRGVDLYSSHNSSCELATRAMRELTCDADLPVGNRVQEMRPGVVKAVTD